jgi:orotidine-5'-phosphate decarboxylase
MNFDAITLQPYMGTDSVRPFLRRKNKFVFMLVLTSNYGASDFQFLKVGKIHLYEAVMQRAIEWSTQKIGFVVGANHDRELKRIMSKYEDVPVLIPGIGSQKNSLDKLSKAIGHKMFMINQSRSIIYSANEANDADRFKEIIRVNAIKARDEIENMVNN